MKSEQVTLIFKLLPFDFIGWRNEIFQSAQTERAGMAQPGCYSYTPVLTSLSSSSCRVIWKVLSSSPLTFSITV